MTKDNATDSRQSWASAPDDVPDEALDLWPEIDKWPSPLLVAQLAVARESRPADYQSVVNGLRWYTTGDLASAWSLLTTWLAVVAILLAALSPVLGVWAVWTAVGLAVGFSAMLVRITSIVEDHTDRTRHASLWLNAIQEASPPLRRRLIPWSWKREGR